MAKERKTFAISVRIKKSKQGIEELHKQQEIELEADKNVAKNVQVSDRGKITGGEIVKFEKDGKVYEVKVMINELKKGLFKDKLVSAEIDLPPGSDFTIEPSGSKSGKRWEIELADNPLKPGGIFLMIGIAAVIIGGIVAFILWKKKKG